MIYGYARVSTKTQARDGNSLEAQEAALRSAGATEIYKDAFTGTKADRPMFSSLLGKLTAGNTLIVTKLDRFARSFSEGSTIVNDLIARGIRVHFLNIGIMDDTPSSKLIRNIFFAFAEFEWDMIVERTTEGRSIARQRKDYKEGRPAKYDQEQVAHALELLETHSYSQVCKLTGISRSTLIRAKSRQMSQRECEGHE